MDVLEGQGFDVAVRAEGVAGPLPGRHVGEVVVVALGLALVGLVLGPEVAAARLLTGEGVEAHDLRELEEYGRTIEEQLTVGLEKIRSAIQSEPDSLEEDVVEEPGLELEPDLQAGPTDFDRGRVESLFEQALRDRAKAFELKRELDRLGVFREYENRFLDLFRKRAQ